MDRRGEVEETCSRGWREGERGRQGNLRFWSTWAPLCWFLSLSQNPHGSTSWGEGSGFGSDPIRESEGCVLHVLGPLE